MQQSWPRSLLDDSMLPPGSDHLLRDMAGNAFCGGIVAAILLGLLAALPARALIGTYGDELSSPWKLPGGMFLNFQLRR